MACRLNLFRSLFCVLVLCQRILAIDFGQSYSSSYRDLRLPRRYTEHDLKRDETSNHVNFHPEGATEGFYCHYPELNSQDWEGCNGGVDSRWCWLRQAQTNESTQRKGYTVTTDYDNYAPIGIQRHYHLDIAKHTIAPDGKPREARLFNGTYPGPLIEACWGDTVIVHVTNSLDDEGSVIHWHGLRQYYNNDQDGVALTQCPIARGSTWTYNFTMLQYGTTWYHSHYPLQYADGVLGPLVVHGPASAPYDVSYPLPHFMTDWVHKWAMEEFENEKDPKVRGAKADNILLDGVGRNKTAVSAYDGQDIRSLYPITEILPGQRVRLRLINGATGTSFIFSVDGHSMEVIANDLVPVKPKVVDSLLVAIGQRYDIIIHGLENPSAAGNYWIRTTPADGCNTFRNGDFDSTDSTSPDPLDTRTGILHYDIPNATYLSLPESTENNIADYSCARISEQDSLRPIVPWSISKTPLNNLALSTFYAAHQTKSEVKYGNYTHWLLRLDPAVEESGDINFHNPMFANFSTPSLLNLTSVGQGKNDNVVRLPYSSNSSDFIHMVIDGSLLPSTNQTTLNPDIIPRLAHPMHWHGSDVVLLAQSEQPFDPATSRDTWNYDNPPRRDTIMAPAGGYVAVAFKPDNPGVWLVHCHIAWHASAGLALQMVIDDGNGMVQNMLDDDKLDKLRGGCDEWKADLGKVVRHNKVDSGV
ncbi:multicopper oxidase-domain-containing protein [Neurospora tetraspora]|uniref:Multicopper oxidase-domain-containing protein n=1 Tax=Neurospora tetraspora TaxID=94610 RepID=A0AAE0MT28_9PEZI|nr:multicopper oxidase-domain-containing protein [Neurospora tetraspora]